MKKPNFVSSSIKTLFSLYRPKNSEHAKLIGKTTRSADGVRVFRDDMRIGWDRKHFPGIPHVHLEIRDPDTGRITTNNKVRVEETKANNSPNGDQSHDHRLQLHQRNDSD
jgi:hypothetical protein